MKEIQNWTWNFQWFDKLIIKILKMLQILQKYLKFTKKLQK